MSDSSTDAASKIQQKLRKAGEQGLVGSKLLSKKNSPERPLEEQVIEDLVAKRVLANLGTAKTPRYVLIEFFKPLEMACAAIEKKSPQGKATLFTIAELAKGTGGAVREAVPEAINWLAKEHKLIPAKRGKTTYYLFTASIRDWLGAAEPAPTGFDERVLRNAYDQLVRESGLPDVRISDLHRKSGFNLEQLQSWLIEQSRAGRIAPSRGDWSLGSEEQRSAAITIQDEPFMKVRFL